jgi:putative ATPase
MKAKENMKRYAPLADSMRSQKLEEFFGQEKLVGKDSFLRRAIESDSVPSLIFWGPPGSGKTTLASIIANETGSEFIQLSGVASGKRDLMSVVERAKKIKKDGKRTILFIDEIHRWNKAQQDALLPYVENGTVTLIGATTENPSFEVISALISRSRILVLEKLEPRDIEKILRRALEDKVRGLGNEKIKISDNDISILSKLANGDARMALNTLEAAAQLSAEISAKTGQTRMIDSELIKKVLQKSHLYYDKTGEEHYNIISALHKSMRGGDANAALYWLARMLEGGEDPKYVARRLLRFASEDVGLADNFALVLANNVFDACHKIGYPECSVHLAQLAIYLSKAPKSVKAYFAYE